MSRVGGENTELRKQVNELLMLLKIKRLWLLRIQGLQKLYLPITRRDLEGPGLQDVAAAQEHDL